MRFKSFLVAFCIVCCLLAVAIKLRAPNILDLIGPDFAISLPYGYSLVQTTPGNVSMDLGNKCLVDANIDGYRVYENITIGHVSKAPEFYDSVPGYFIADLTNGKKQQGLSRQQWIKELRKHSIVHVPTLHRPTGLDELNGYNRPINP